MGCCNRSATALATATSDPSQHVNYAKGMVLGVDDFTQEFAYLAGRDQWLARDAIGFGTLCGLRVFAESAGAEGPRLHVSAGTALVPSGKLVCVPADQCAVIDRWLAKKENAATVTRLLDGGSPPLSPPAPPSLTAGTVTLYLTLCYADCTTRPVPIPGEPCRSADELMADSRVADDYRLELRATAPDQAEEDALRDFVRWLSHDVQVADSSPAASDETAWLQALRAAVAPWLSAAAASPPLSPPVTFASLGDYLFDVSPPPLTVAPAALGDFLRVALRFWVTELRPLWQAVRCQRTAGPDADCVLLARVLLDVEWVGGSPTGAWQITGSPASLTVDESTRPILGSLRLLEEWLLGGLAGGVAAAAAGGGGSGAGGGGGSGSPALSPFIVPDALAAHAPDDAAYIVASDDPALPNAQSLGALGSGLLKNTVAAGAGTLSAAVPGTDFVAPGSIIPVSSGGTGTGSAPANGQLLIGNAGGFALAGLTGTPNQVNVAAGPGSITLSTPQALATTSSPTFAGLTTTGQASVAGLASSAPVSVAGLTTSTLTATAAASVGGLTSTAPATLAGLSTTAAVHVKVDKAANGMTLGAQHHVLLCKVATLNLPAAHAPTTGRVYVLKNAGIKLVTVSAAPGDTIDGSATIGIPMWEAATLVSDGSGHWFALARG